jgi:hypothetical protein
MDLDEADIREFADLWKHEFREDLTSDEARHHASLLIELYVAIASPLPSENLSVTNSITHARPCDISSTVENPAKTKIVKSSP